MRAAGWILTGALLAGLTACGDDDPAGAGPAPTPAPAQSVVAGLRLGAPQTISVDGSRTSRGAREPSVSANGDRVAFTAPRADLLAGDRSPLAAVFVKERSSGRMFLASAAADGAPADRPAGMPAISADGRFVAFVSAAANLGGSGSREHIYVKNLDTGGIVRATADVAGVAANGDSSDPVLSADGGRVAFVSRAANLAAGDTNTSRDVYVKDLTTGQVTLVSETDGRAIGGLTPDLSADGRAVVFDTEASAVQVDAPDDARGLFVRDLSSGVLTMAHVSAADGPGTACPSISEDGVRVAFRSVAKGLVPDDADDLIDVFSRELRRGTISRVSVTGANRPIADVGCPELSGDGGTVLFPAGQELFLKDLVSGDLAAVGAASSGYALSPTGRAVAFRVLRDGVVLRERR